MFNTSHSIKFKIKDEELILRRNNLDSIIMKVDGLKIEKFNSPSHFSDKVRYENIILDVCYIYNEVVLFSYSDDDDGFFPAILVSEIDDSHRFNDFIFKIRRHIKLKAIK